MNAILRAVSALSVLLAGHLAGVGLDAASAHEGDGVLVVESQGPAAGLSVPYVVRLAWADDGHAAIDATITATAVAADGTSQTPVPMEPMDQDGRYAATVTYPASGSWTVRFTAVTPTASIEVTEPVVADAATTNTQSTTTVPETDTAPIDEARTVEDAGNGGVGVRGVLAAALLVAVVAGCVIGFARPMRRRATDREERR